MGDAIRTVQDAFGAVSGGRFDELGALLSPELDWWGLDEATGDVQHCHGRQQALGWMRAGAAAAGAVDVGEFVEAGPLVMVPARRLDGGDSGDRSGAGRRRWMIAEVRDGLIVRLQAFGDGDAARRALAAGTLAD